MAFLTGSLKDTLLDQKQPNRNSVQMALRTSRNLKRAIFFQLHYTYIYFRYQDFSGSSEVYSPVLLGNLQQ